MNKIFQLSFGGLTKSYYFRHLIFGVLIFAWFYWLLTNGKEVFPTEQLPKIIMFGISALLYPYSRFVYEIVIGFIFGENVFIFAGSYLLIMYFIKFATMLCCFCFAIFIAPVGLIGLYIYHNNEMKKIEKMESENEI